MRYALGDRVAFYDDDGVIAVSEITDILSEDDINGLVLNITYLVKCSQGRQSWLYESEIISVATVDTQIESLIQL